MLGVLVLLLASSICGVLAGWWLAGYFVLPSHVRFLDGATLVLLCFPVTGLLADSLCGLKLSGKMAVFVAVAAAFLTGLILSLSFYAVWGWIGTLLFWLGIIIVLFRLFLVRSLRRYAAYRDSFDRPFPRHVADDDSDRTLIRSGPPDDAATRVSGVDSPAGDGDEESLSPSERTPLFDEQYEASYSKVPTHAVRRDAAQAPAAESVLDSVHFSVTCPPTMALGSFHVVDVWLHQAGALDEVIERARKIHPDHAVAGSKGPAVVARGALVTVRLWIDGIDVDEPEDVVLWDGQLGNATFPVEIPRDAQVGSRRGTVMVCISGLPICRIHFGVKIAAVVADHTPVNIAPLETKVSRYKTAFASYASPDCDAVLARLQGIQKVARELDVFLDVLSLRSGQNWQDRLRTEIIQRDVMYLFWSQAASQSKWVEWEWRCALAERGLEFIDPVPLVSPKRVPPPRELSGLHFGDWMLSHMAGVASDAASAQTAGTGPALTESPFLLDVPELKHARRIVIVFSKSFSSAQGGFLEHLKSQIMSTVKALDEEQSFGLFAYDARVFQAFDRKPTNSGVPSSTTIQLHPAHAMNKARLRDWLGLVSAGGLSDGFVSAMSAALKTDADLIVVVSRKDLEPTELHDVLESLAKQNPIPIHCVSLDDAIGLKELAKRCMGVFFPVR